MKVFTNVNINNIEIAQSEADEWMWYTSFHHEVENGNLILFLFLYYKKRDKEFKFICFLLSIATTLTA